MARAMYKRAPTDEQLAALGLTREDYADDDNEVIEVWPENWPIFELWQIVGDQWRTGPAGPVAIDLIPVFHELDRAENMTKEEYDDMLSGIKIVADVALSEIHKT